MRAGLALVDAVRELQAPERLQVRIGIATGLVVVGDLIGTGEAQERGVVGETPNLAARLQALAEPNTVVIGPTTRRLLGNLFECHLDIHVPGHDIVATQKAHEDAYAAITEAFDVAFRQLETFQKMDRGNVKAHTRESDGPAQLS